MTCAPAMARVQSGPLPGCSRERRPRPRGPEWFDIADDDANASLEASPFEIEIPAPGETGGTQAGCNCDEIDDGNCNSEYDELQEQHAHALALQAEYDELQEQRAHALVPQAVLAPDSCLLLQPIRIGLAGALGFAAVLSAIIVNRCSQVAVLVDRTATLEASLMELLQVSGNLSIDHVRVEESMRSVGNTRSEIKRVSTPWSLEAGFDAKPGAAVGVREVFSLAENLAWVRGFEAEKPEVQQPVRSVEGSREARTPHGDDRSANPHITPRRVESVASQPSLEVQRSAGRELAPTEVSAEEIAERRTLLQSQVRAMKEQGYAVLLAPPDEGPEHLEHLESGDLSSKTSSRRVPGMLEALLLDVGLSPYQALSVATSLAKQGVHVGNIDGVPPQTLAAALSSPHLGLDAGEQLRTLTGLWHRGSR